jgi:predicted AAA+ superfamily ATPase
MYQRTILPQVLYWLDKRQIVILYGSRQVGKTTLTQEIADYYKSLKGYLETEILQVSGDDISIHTVLSSQSLRQLKSFVGSAKLLIVDEAQRIANIGINLKILHDNLPNLRIVATGSSSFDLANKINEPLTGRNIKFTMTPFSFQELSEKTRIWDLKQGLEDLMIYGSYPKVINSQTIEDKKAVLKNLANDYLYRDVLEWENLKKPELLMQILQYLALQIGSTVSYNNIANSLNTNPKTIEKYINLLEQSFVIFKLRAFSRNRNNELVKSFKVYFWDLGIRNTLIDKYNSFAQREDVGNLWENFCILERMKYNHNNLKYGNYYFWRNLNQNEVDFIEDYDGILHGFEFKYTKSKILKGSYNFLKEYPTSVLELINKDNIEELLMIE